MKVSSTALAGCHESVEYHIGMLSRKCRVPHWHVVTKMSSTALAGCHESVEYRLGIGLMSRRNACGADIADFYSVLSWISSRSHIIIYSMYLSIARKKAF